MLRIFIILNLFFCFSCRVPEATVLKLYTFYDNGEIAPESRVHFYIDSDDKSYLALDTFMVTNTEGWLMLKMPGECYVDALAVKEIGAFTYAGKQQFHLVENREIIDTLLLFDSNK